MSYLNRLASQISRARQLDAERRGRHARFIFSQQMSDGGFRGREGDSDLYYTSFAVRALDGLGALDAANSGPILAFLKLHDWQELGVIDLMNWLATAATLQLAGAGDPLAGALSGWDVEVATRLEALRRSDGGYAKAEAGAQGSTYHSFLVALTYELLGRQAPRPNALAQFVLDRQREDGGFVEIGPMRHSGTNPTAAACALLLMLDRLDEQTRCDVAAFLNDVRSAEGAYQANRRIPFADGLSTFTAVLTLRDLGFQERIDRQRIRDFVAGQLEFPTGGLRAAAWDETADVEYTFYGLGLLALLLP